MNEAYYFHDGVLNKSSIDPILQFLKENRGPVHIGIRSEGGSLYPSSFLVNVLNQNRDRVTLSAVEYVYSSGFDVFYFFRGQRSMTHGCMGMTHYGSQDQRVDWRNKSPYHEEGKAMAETNAVKLSHQDQWCKPIMTASEFEAMTRGDDVYFNFDRMTAIFPKIPIF